MRNAPPGTRCAHEDGRKGCESMRPGSDSGQGLSTEEKKKKKRKKEKKKKKNTKSIREVRPCLQEKMENQTVWHRPQPLPSRSGI
ncbi:hypothetical protein ACN42_g2713 [Penicillium freii]|uniref:Uncharacterized protein n=1 Tax=Penicillium freii TaxID=48697 RepID=A0A101MPK7_PENFR|nr:hypothetical protein ACN42_g2713 [Penicillium freii]